MQETPQKNRTIMSVIAVIIGLLMAYFNSVPGANLP